MMKTTTGSLLCCSFILLLLAVLKRSSAQCTKFQFTVQPPSNLDCSPFDVVPATPVWRLRTKCTVVSLNGSKDFDINWFHRKRTGEVENLARPDSWTDTDTEEEAYFGGHLTNRPYNVDMLGEYWCQVIDVTNQEHLGISNVFTINDPHSYSVGRCTRVQEVTETLCADSPPLISSSISEMSPSSSVGLINPSKSQTLMNELTTHFSMSPSDAIITSSVMIVASIKPSDSITSSLVNDNRFTSTEIGETLFMSSSISVSTTPGSVSAKPNDNGMLLVVSAAAIVMLLLIIILLITIIVLINTKPRQRRKLSAVAHGKDMQEAFKKTSVRSSRHKLLPSEVTAPTSPKRSVLSHNISTISKSPSAHIYDEMIECSVESSPAHLTRSINHQPVHPYDEVTLSYSHNTVPIPPPPQFRSDHKVQCTEWEHNNPTYMQPPPAPEPWTNSTV